MKVIFWLISFVFVFYCFPLMKADFMNSNTIEKYKYSKKVVIIYDDFQSDHGPVDLDVFKKQLSRCSSASCKNLSVLTLDYNKVDYDSFFHVIEKLSTTAEKVYINISFTPTEDYSRDFMIYNIKRITKIHQNIRFFIAMGNNEYIEKDLSSFWSKVNKSGRIRNIIMKEPKISPNIYKTQEIAKIFYFVFGDILGLDKIDQIKVEIAKNGENADIDEIYSSIEDFAFTARLQHIPNVFLVSGYDSFNIPEIIKAKDLNITDDMLGVGYSLNTYKSMDLNSSFLDCQIDGLIVNKIRDVDTYYERVEGGYAPICGTSIASPIHMARYVCSNI